MESTVEGVSHVLNYDMPMNLDSYIHRAGRAGRASRSGEAISFATRRDRGLIRSIERYLGVPMNVLGERLSDGTGATRVRERVAGGESDVLLEGNSEIVSDERDDSQRRPRQSRPRRDGGGGFQGRSQGADTRSRGPRRGEGTEGAAREGSGEVSSFAEQRGPRERERPRFGRDDRGGRSSDRGGRFNREGSGSRGPRTGGRGFGDRSPSFEGLGRERSRDVHASEQQSEGRRRSGEAGSFDTNRERPSFNRFGNDSRGGGRGPRSRDGGGRSGGRDGAPFQSSRGGSSDGRREGRFNTERSPRFDGSDRGNSERSFRSEGGPRPERRDSGFDNRRERSGAGRSPEGRQGGESRGRDFRRSGGNGGEGRFNSRGRTGGSGGRPFGNKRRGPSNRESQPSAE